MAKEKTHISHSERRYAHVFDAGGTYYFFFVARMGLNAAHFISKSRIAVAVFAFGWSWSLWFGGFETTDRTRCRVSSDRRQESGTLPGHFRSASTYLTLKQAAKA
jgi:hypothetical protein